MTLFVGTITSKLDKKGRVSIPASFRAALEGIGSLDLIVSPSFYGPCLEGWPESAFEAIAAASTPASALDDPQDDLLITLFSRAEKLRPDPEGRVVLSPAMIEHARLTDAAMFMAKGRSFQVWEPSAGKEREAEAFRAHAMALAARRAARSPTS